MPKRKTKYSKAHTVAYVISVIVAIAMIAASYVMYKTITEMNVFPTIFTDYLLYALIAVNVFFGLIAVIRPVNTFNKSLQIFFCGALAAGMILVDVYIPNYLGQFERMFNEVPEEGTLLMSVYVKSDSEKYGSVKDLQEAKVGVLAEKDADYLDYSTKVISRELNGAQITTVPYDDVYNLAEDLLENNVDAILMNQTYAQFISQNSDFSGFNYNTKILYTIENKIKLEYDTEKVGSITTEPFIIAVSGNDGWSYKGCRYQCLPEHQQH